MKEKFSGIFGVAFILSFVAGVSYGYVNNIVSLVSDVESTGMMVGRIIGIFMAPIGIVLGYF